MHTRLTRIILGGLCLLAAVPPGWVACALFTHMATTKRPDGPNEQAITSSWESYLFAPTSALVALVLVAIGLFFIMSELNTGQDMKS